MWDSAAFASSAFWSPVTSDIPWVCELAALPLSAFWSPVTSDMAWECDLVAYFDESAVPPSVMLPVTAMDGADSEPVRVPPASLRYRLSWLWSVAASALRA